MSIQSDERWSRFLAGVVLASCAFAVGFGLGDDRGYERGRNAADRALRIHVGHTESCLSMQKHGGHDYTLFTGSYRFINGRLHCYDSKESLHKHGRKSND